MSTPPHAAQLACTCLVGSSSRAPAVPSSRLASPAREAYEATWSGVTAKKKNARVHPSARPYVRSLVRPSAPSPRRARRSFRASVRPAGQPAIGLCSCLSILPSVRLSVRASVLPAICPTYRPSVRPSVTPWVRASVCLSGPSSMDPSITSAALGRQARGSGKPSCSQAARAKAGEALR